MDAEIAWLIRGWAYFLLGGLVSTLIIVSGYPIAAIIWLTLTLYGLIILIVTFIKYQKPYLKVYARFYRDKFEFERAVHSVRFNKEDKE